MNVNYINGLDFSITGKKNTLYSLNLKNYKYTHHYQLDNKRVNLQCKWLKAHRFGLDLSLFMDI